MPPFLQLHALAATRGDGLRPELRRPHERYAEVREADSKGDAALNLCVMDVVGLSSGTMPMSSSFV